MSATPGITEHHFLRSGRKELSSSAPVRHTRGSKREKVLQVKAVAAGVLRSEAAPIEPDSIFHCPPEVVYITINESVSRAMNIIFLLSLAAGIIIVGRKL